MRASEILCVLGLVLISASAGIAPFSGMGALGLIVGGLVIGVLACFAGMICEDEGM